MSRALAVISVEQPSFRGRSEPHATKASAVDAQVAGQTGARRGLRGGAPVLNAARAAYLDAEWRGADDRRLPTGAIRKVTL